MSRHICSSLDVFKASNEAFLVFSVDGDKSACAVENGFKGFSLVHEQCASGGTHENLDSTDAWDTERFFCSSHGLLQVADIVRRGADEEAVIVDALLRGGLQF